MPRRLDQQSPHVGLPALVIDPELAAGGSPTRRSDVEVMFKDLPEPIDLEIDPHTRTLYWTDRGDPPHGNTVCRARLDALDGSGHRPIGVVQADRQQQATKKA